MGLGLWLEVRGWEEVFLEGFDLVDSCFGGAGHWATTVWQDAACQVARIGPITLLQTGA